MLDASNTLKRLSVYHVRSCKLQCFPSHRVKAARAEQKAEQPHREGASIV